MVLEQPVHAVERAATLLVGGQRDDDVAVRHVALRLVLKQDGDPHRGLRLVITRSTAIEIAVLLREQEWIDAPVLALGLHDVRVGDQQQRLARARAMIPDDEVRLPGVGAIHMDVRVRKPGRLEARSGRKGNRRGGARRESRRDLDELLVDRASKCLLGGWSRRDLRRQRAGHEHGEHQRDQRRASHEDTGEECGAILYRPRRDHQSIAPLLVAMKLWRA